MDKQLKEFFCDQVERGYLSFEADLDYNALMTQSLALFPGGDLPGPIFDLMDTANLISFAHGLRLGLRLREWSNS